MELYRKYRPAKLDDIVGNQETVQSIRNMLQRKTLPHVLLFHGPAGCGKTTLSRIVAAHLKCGQIDLQEVNSSSFRGIDTVRDMARVVNLAPAAGPCRVWILDEVHKWTNDAQNGALKMLEDTPRHVYFLLCTTDPQKLIKPLQTRCCDMPVRALTYDELDGLVTRVARAEKVHLADDAKDALVAAAQGSARTALVLLDKVANLEEKEQAAAVAARMAEENAAIDLCRCLIKKSPWKRITEILKNLTTDPESVRWAVLGYARSVLLSGGKPDPQAFIVIDCFSRPFYDTKEAGLAAACWEALETR